MKGILIRLTAASAILALAGCATAPQAPQLPTVITINTVVPLSALKAAAIETYFSEGWTLERESEHMLVFISENTNFAARVLYGTQYDTRVMNRENLLITQGPSGTTLRVNQVIVTNYGSAFEKANPVDGYGGRRLQKIQYAVEVQQPESVSN